jgi:hypothetical protein
MGVNTMAAFFKMAFLFSEIIITLTLGLKKMSGKQNSVVMLSDFA